MGLMKGKSNNLAIAIAALGIVSATAFAGFNPFQPTRATVISPFIGPMRPLATSPLGAFIGPIRPTITQPTATSDTSTGEVTIGGTGTGGSLGVTVTGTDLPSGPTSPLRPPIRDPFRPPLRSPFTP